MKGSDLLDEFASGFTRRIVEPSSQIDFNPKGIFFELKNLWVLRGFEFFPRRSGGETNRDQFSNWRLGMTCQFHQGHLRFLIDLDRLTVNTSCRESIVLVVGHLKE